MVSANKRREKDVMKLLVSDYEVTLVNECSTSEFIVKFFGPKDSHYEGVSLFPTAANYFSFTILIMNFCVCVGCVASACASTWLIPL